MKMDILKNVVVSFLVVSLLDSCSVNSKNARIITNGSITKLSKSGVFGSSGVRFTSNISNENAWFTISEPKFGGQEYTYWPEVRFYDIQGRSIVLPQSLNPHIKLLLLDKDGERIYWTGRLRDKWIRTASGKDASDHYYYLLPIAADISPVHIQSLEHFTIKCYVTDGSAIPYTISLRTGGYK